MTSLKKDDFGFESLPHYSTHAIEFLDDVYATLTDAGVPANYEQFIANLLRESVKFVLPESGFLFEDHDYAPKMFELQRVPYPVCAMEFRAGPALYAEGSGLHNSPKRIALCFDPHQLPAEMQSSFSSLIQASMESLPPRCLAMTAVFSGEDLDWCAAVGFVLLDLEIDKPILLSDSASVIGKSIDPLMVAEHSGNRIQGTPTKHALPSTFLAIPERSRLMGQTSSEALDALYIDTLDEVRTTYEFLAALNCSNVGTQTIAAPSKLNAKREKNGKTPFFAYKVLDLAPSSESSPGAGGVGGASPRTHLRRGHLRRLGEKFGNKTLWINATMVNASHGNSVSTSYKVRGRPVL